eukprot:TRINITY_DN994_c0_g4_i1.p1 TRINITY_DN994_c0_g4~~TRINITY_DN994_c0_g4_i1.p1  ORF type:complete len:324 (-),score=57.31 TRINITY_DN994_c0_g4_i1:53-1024(-)
MIMHGAAILQLIFTASAIVLLILSIFVYHRARKSFPKYKSESFLLGILLAAVSFGYGFKFVLNFIIIQFYPCSRVLFIMWLFSWSVADTLFIVTFLVHLLFWAYLYENRHRISLVAIEESTSPLIKRTPLQGRVADRLRTTVRIAQALVIFAAIILDAAQVSILVRDEWTCNSPEISIDRPQFALWYEVLWTCLYFVPLLVLIVFLVHIKRKVFDTYYEDTSTRDLSSTIPQSTGRIGFPALLTVVAMTAKGIWLLLMSLDASMRDAVTGSVVYTSFWAVMEVPPLYLVLIMFISIPPQLDQRKWDSNASIRGLEEDEIRDEI